MPAATTHAEFAKDVFLALDQTCQREISDLPMYLVGSQGPDLLFFSGFSVLPSSLAWIGGRMHDEKIPEVIRYLDDHASSDPALRSYFSGYLCHYALDVMVHPLVYAFSQAEANETGRPETEIHYRIESEYDIHVLSRRGKTWKDYDVYRNLKLSDPDVRRLAILYEGMLKKIFGISVTQAKLMRAIRDAALMTRLLRPSKLKYAAAGWLEKTTRAPHLITGMMLNGNKTATALNAAHRPWSPVFDAETERRESFDDLYQKALVFAVQIIRSHSDTDFTRDFCGAPLREH